MPQITLLSCTYVKVGLKMAGANIQDKHANNIACVFNKIVQKNGSSLLENTNVYKNNKVSSCKA
jgi:hypothetical protein